MQIQVQTFTVHKRFPLAISRHTTTQTTNLFVRLEHEGLEGWGEASPFSIGDHRQTTESILEGLAEATEILEPFSPIDRQAIEQQLLRSGVPSAARAAIEMACYDWLGKRVGLPLWQLLGLDRQRIVPTSVTIGLNPPEVARQRVRDWIALTGARIFKIKMGNREGIEADQAMLLAIREEFPHAVLRVDANGGWSLPDAIRMCQWLAGQGIEYVEQPLPHGQEEALAELYRHSPIPIFVDESCFTSQDIIRLADRVHGINIKLMKCGGLSEMFRMVHTARACGLQVMLGCYSDSSLAITAAAHLSPLADYLDLDSHLNLIDDPFQGAELQAGRVVPNDRPGLGVNRRG